MLAPPIPHALLLYGFAAPPSEGGVSSSTAFNLSGSCDYVECDGCDAVPVPSTALIWPGSFCCLPLGAQSHHVGGPGFSAGESERN